MNKNRKLILLLVSIISLGASLLIAVQIHNSIIEKDKLSLSQKVDQLFQNKEAISDGEIVENSGQLEKDDKKHYILSSGGFTINQLSKESDGFVKTEDIAGDLYYKKDYYGSFLSYLYGSSDRPASKDLYQVSYKFLLLGTEDNRKISYTDNTYTEIKDFPNGFSTDFHEIKNIKHPTEGYLIKNEQRYVENDTYRIEYSVIKTYYALQDDAEKIYKALMLHLAFGIGISLIIILLTFIALKYIIPTDKNKEIILKTKWQNTEQNLLMTFESQYFKKFKVTFIEDGKIKKGIAKFSEKNSQINLSFPDSELFYKINSVNENHLEITNLATSIILHFEILGLKEKAKTVNSDRNVNPVPVTYTAPLNNKSFIKTKRFGLIIFSLAILGIIIYGIFFVVKLQNERIKRTEIRILKQAKVIEKDHNGVNHLFQLDLRNQMIICDAEGNLSFAKEAEKYRLNPKYKYDIFEIYYLENDDNLLLFIDDADGEASEHEESFYLDKKNFKVQWHDSNSYDHFTTGKALNDTLFLGLIGGVVSINLATGGTIWDKQDELRQLRCSIVCDSLEITGNTINIWELKSVRTHDNKKITFNKSTGEILENACPPNLDFSVNHDTLYSNDTLIIRFASPHPGCFAINDNVDTLWYAIASNNSGGIMKEDVFLKTPALRIIPNKDAAIPSKFGVNNPRLIFSNTGTYTFLMSDNDATEGTPESLTIHYYNTLRRK